MEPEPVTLTLTVAGTTIGALALFGAVGSFFQWLGVRPARCLPCQTPQASDLPPPNNLAHYDFRMMDLMRIVRMHETRIGALETRVGALETELRSFKKEVRRMFAVNWILFAIVLLPEERREWLLSIRAIIGGDIMDGSVFLCLVGFLLCPNFMEDELLGSFLYHLGSFLRCPLRCALVLLRRALDRMNATVDPPAPAPSTPPTRAGPPEVDSGERLMDCLETIANNEDQDGSARRFVNFKVKKMKFVSDQVQATATALTQLSPSGANSARSRSMPQMRRGPSSQITNTI